MAGLPSLACFAAPVKGSVFFPLPAPGSNATVDKYVADARGRIKEARWLPGNAMTFKQPQGFGAQASADSETEPDDAVRDASLSYTFPYPSAALRSVDTSADGDVRPRVDAVLQLRRAPPSHSASPAAQAIAAPSVFQDVQPQTPASVKIDEMAPALASLATPGTPLPAVAVSLAAPGASLVTAPTLVEAKTEPVNAETIRATEELNFDRGQPALAAAVASVTKARRARTPAAVPADATPATPIPPQVVIEAQIPTVTLATVSVFEYVGKHIDACMEGPCPAAFAAIDEVAADVIAEDAAIDAAIAPLVYGSDNGYESGPDVDDLAASPVGDKSGKEVVPEALTAGDSAYESLATAEHRAKMLLSRHVNSCEAELVRDLLLTACSLYW